MARRFQITAWCHERIRHMMLEPVNCIDATAGTGRDTLFLLELSGPEGTVVSMDIQEEALRQTRERAMARYPDTWDRRLTLILDGHEHMDRYFGPESTDLILFNLGYLPGGDHSLATKPETTIAGLEQSLGLLRPGGLLSVLIYSGGDSGFEEKDTVLAWAKELDPDQYLVLKEEFHNRPNHPPLPLFIQKLP